VENLTLCTPGVNTETPLYLLLSSGRLRGGSPPFKGEIKRGFSSFQGGDEIASGSAL